ncbi:unnamed protein product [Echinostoma caproni]|uniref:DDE_Tnp_ISL3 domain-containing protein n=1 Tax=Echinostoma caproni TaxID=27848 RepID=A0A183AN94_9TREM|nr:unnamed protein product [Echinostoma caproni]
MTKSSSSILGLAVIRVLNNSVIIHTSTASNVHTHLRHLIANFSNNFGGMNVQPAKLEVDGEPIFMKRRVIQYGQREGVLKAIGKKERDGIVTRLTLSTWCNVPRPTHLMHIPKPRLRRITLLRGSMVQDL